MAWGPQGEYKKTETPITRADLEKKFSEHPWEPLGEFLAIVKDTDILLDVNEGDNHRGASYYVAQRWIGHEPNTEGRRPIGDCIKIILVYSSFMS